MSCLPVISAHHVNVYAFDVQPQHQTGREWERVRVLLYYLSRLDGVYDIFPEDPALLDPFGSVDAPMDSPIMA